MLISTTGTLSPDHDFLVYHGPYKEIIPQMAADGYKGVEMHIFDSTEIDRKELWGLLREYGLKLTSIGTGSVYERMGYSLGAADPAVRKAAIRHMEQHMVTAVPDHAVVILGLVAGRFSDCKNHGEEFKKNLTDSLHKLDELAVHYDVSLGFEIMNRFESDYLNTIAQGVEYLKAQKFQKLLLHIDTVHLNIEEANIGDAIRAAQGYIGHVHVADNDRWYPGHAHYDFRETIQALKDIGYHGALALETNCEPDPETCAKKSLEYLTKILGE